MNSDELASDVATVEGWLSEHEALLLFFLAELTPASGEIVEIGSWKGKSTICLGQGLRRSGKAGRLYAIDPHKGIIATGKRHQSQTYTDFLRNIKSKKVRDLVVPVRKTSVAAAKKWQKTIRLLFIDGLHDYKHADEDYRLWERFVTHGGIIAFHDGFCGEDGVWRIIKELVLHRGDIKDMGTAGSIFYIVIGSPSLFDAVKVLLKKQIVLVSNAIHRTAMPMYIKHIVIHKILRLVLLTEYTLAVYTQN